MKRTLNGLLLAASTAIIPATVVALSAGTAQAATLTCPNLDKIEQVFLNQHILYKDADAALEARTIEQYIKRLDSAKIYLLESDINDIKKQMKGIFAQLRKGECSSLDKVQKLFENRVSERAAFAKKTLSAKSFKFEPKTELMLDPDARKYAKNRSEADSFQTKYLQFQVSNYLATNMKQNEAQEQVVRNYDRVVKRVKDTKLEDIYSGYLDSFGRALDPHTSYFSADTWDDFEISMSLSLEGIGATLSSQDGFTVIEQLIEGGSAKASNKLQAQDKIVAVGQFKASGETEPMENVVEMELRDVVKRIRGPKGTKVRLEILRKGDKGGSDHLFVDLVRDKIKLEDDAAQLTWTDREVNGKKEKIAILNLPSFYADSRRGGRSSADDMARLLKEAREKGAAALVLDLSQNGGGSLDDAVKIAGLFFKTGNVVKQSSRDHSQAATALADRDPQVNWAGPLVVLTSRISASASEIVSGTLKDYNRAVIVGGDHTFGKGSVQSVVPLPPKLGAVKVTVGMFYTAGGYSTQHRGVPGDIVWPSPFATDDIGENKLDYSLKPDQLPAFTSPEAYVTSGTDAWKKIEAPVIAQLKSRSEARVSKNPEFAKITDELKKNKDRNKVIKLSEALKDTKEKKDEADSKKNQNKEEKTADYMKKAEVMEAANVAADLIALQNGITLTDAKSPDASKKTKN
jgi:carboxyl-terminal processing protease